MKQKSETVVIHLENSPIVSFKTMGLFHIGPFYNPQKMKRSNRLTWNGRTVLNKTPQLSPKGDDRCFAYCFILR